MTTYSSKSTSSVSNPPTSAKSYTWTCSAFLKIILFTLTFTFTPAKAAAHPRAGKNDTATKKTTICYKGYGCFSVNPPFNPKMPVPLGEAALGTKFILRTREHPTDFSITSKAAIGNSTFNANRPTKVLIHGFVLSSNNIASWVPSMADTILQNDDVNVIIVNWVQGARMNYDQAASNTRMVGAQIHKLVKYLMKNHNARAKDMHLIGFSLGAHVAGFAGKLINNNTKGRKLGRISGLDPANPAFNSNSSEIRLDRTDAHFVDVIHTDIRTILHISSGMNRSLGHADFWPNGGESQPGCHNWGGGFFKGFQDMTVCDHLRAPALYEASIATSLPMVGYRCSDYKAFRHGNCLNCRGKVNKHKNNRCAVMGYWAKPPRGNRANTQLDYYLDTSDKAPFAVRQYRIQIHWRKVAGSTTEDGVRGQLFARLHGDKLASDSRKLYLFEDESSQYYHIFHNRTARFVINLPFDQDIGELNKISFWWTRQSCWHIFGCRDTENIFIKRIRVLDAVAQKRYTFISPERLEHRGVKPTEILPGDKVDFVRRTQKPLHLKKKNRQQQQDDVVEPPMRQPIIVRRDTSSSSSSSN